MMRSGTSGSRRSSWPTLVALRTPRSVSGRSQSSVYSSAQLDLACLRMRSWIAHPSVRVLSHVCSGIYLTNVTDCRVQRLLLPVAIDGNELTTQERKSRNASPVGSSSAPRYRHRPHVVDGLRTTLT